MKNLIPTILCGVALVFMGCSNDDDSGTVTTSANFTVTIENMAPVKRFVGSGVFNTPVGDSGPGPATPGKKYEFTFDAGRSQHLTFATMLAATNDLFFGPKGEGIALYDNNGDPISGNVTDQVYLWDAGTEVNEEPGVGPNTVTNQSGPNMGITENGNVLAIEDVTTGFQFDFPPVSDIIKVTLTHIAGTQFKVSLEDLSTAILHTSIGDLPAPLSPGVWVATGTMNSLYTVGMPDYGEGIEGIAEDGSPAVLGMFAAENTGVTYPASPGVWVVHNNSTKPLFTEGMPDYGDGVEAIAEDGNAAPLGGNVATLDGYESGAVFNMPVGSSGPGPILPGSEYVFSFDATSNDNLSFATMLAATNDVFFGAQDSGIALFDSNGQPINGDITDQVYLWDAGTEVNEQPAIGPNTVTNQLSPDTGVEENESVRLLSDVNDGFTYPSVNGVLKVTITSN